jgi:chromate transporter
MSEPGDPKSLSIKQVSLFEIFWTFFVIGATSFGGGVVAYLRNSLISVKGWLDEEEFLTALEISQALPGLNATNMAVIVGDRLRGPVGAVLAFLGMTLPGLTIVLILAFLYAGSHDNANATAVLKGVGAASVGVLLAVSLQVGHRQLAKFLDLSIVFLTAILISFVHISLGIVLLTVGPLAIFLYRPHPTRELKPDRSGFDRKPAD